MVPVIALGKLEFTLNKRLRVKSRLARLVGELGASHGGVVVVAQVRAATGWQWLGWNFHGQRIERGSRARGAQSRRAARPSASHASLATARRHTRSVTTLPCRPRLTTITRATSTLPSFPGASIPLVPGASAVLVPRVSSWADMWKTKPLWQRRRAACGVPIEIHAKWNNLVSLSLHSQVLPINNYYLHL